MRGSPEDWLNAVLDSTLKPTQRQREEHRLREYLCTGGQPPADWDRDKLLGALAVIREMNGWPTHPPRSMFTMAELYELRDALSHAPTRTATSYQTLVKVRKAIKHGRSHLNRERRRIDPSHSDE